MNGAKRPVVLTEYASLRLTPEEDKQVAEAAEKQGLTRSQWLRRTVLQAVACPPEMRLALAELMALRAIVLGLHSVSMPGQESIIKQVADYADSTKFAKADNRILAMHREEKQ
jgi:hypothetical protein